MSLGNSTRNAFAWDTNGDDGNMTDDVQINPTVPCGRPWRAGLLNLNSTILGDRRSRTFFEEDFSGAPRETPLLRESCGTRNSYRYTRFSGQLAATSRKRDRSASLSHNSRENRARMHAPRYGARGNGTCTRALARAHTRNLPWLIRDKLYDRGWPCAYYYDHHVNPIRVTKLAARDDACVKRDGDMTIRLSPRVTDTASRSDGRLIKK